MIVLVLALIVAFLAGGTVGALGQARVARMIPLRTPSNERRIANRETDVKLRELDVQEAEALRAADQVRINHENDRLKGELALEQSRIGHESAMLALETAEAKKGRPELSVGEAIRSRRQELHWTQRQLAANTAQTYCPVSVARISAIENGDEGRIVDLHAVARELDLIFRVEVVRPDRDARPPSVEREKRARDARMAEHARQQEERRAAQPPAEAEIVDA